MDQKGPAIGLDAQGFFQLLYSFLKLANDMRLLCPEECAAIASTAASVGCGMLKKCLVTGQNFGLLKPCSKKKRNCAVSLLCISLVS